MPVCCSLPVSALVQRERGSLAILIKDEPPPPRPCLAPPSVEPEGELLRWGLGWAKLAIGQGCPSCPTLPARMAEGLQQRRRMGSRGRRGQSRARGGRPLSRAREACASGDIHAAEQIGRRQRAWPLFPSPLRPEANPPPGGRWTVLRRGERADCAKAKLPHARPPLLCASHRNANEPRVPSAICSTQPLIKHAGLVPSFCGALHGVRHTSAVFSAKLRLGHMCKRKNSQK